MLKINFIRLWQCSLAIRKEMWPVCQRHRHTIACLGSLFLTLMAESNSGQLDFWSIWVGNWMSFSKLLFQKVDEENPGDAIGVDSFIKLPLNGRLTVVVVAQRVTVFAEMLVKMWQTWHRQEDRSQILGHAAVANERSPIWRQHKAIVDTPPNRCCHLSNPLKCMPFMRRLFVATVCKYDVI